MKRFYFAVLVVTAGILAAGSRAKAAETPDFGANGVVFCPGMKSIQSQIDAVFSKQEKSEFGAGRYAILFKPGAYNLDVQVGFYTQVMGLGRSPDEVEISGAIDSTAKWRRGNATVNFWRCVENLAVTPTRNDHTDVWA